jgi:DNA-binding transcriptional LysR family regulator
LVAANLPEGSLVQLFPEWTLPIGGVFAVYPEARSRPARVGAFIGVLAEMERKRHASANA